ncbi:MAG: EAL domain-containing protein [Gammaproteobacteria bacterium]|nr:EAL domain-containing protein [Gammaproteobacteria bacterium]
MNASHLAASMRLPPARVPVKLNQTMSTISSKFRILVSFAAVMALVVMVAAVGLTRMAENKQRMETIVDQYNVKTDHIIDMYNAARERSISLLRMVNQKDPFDRDEEYMRMNGLATEFALARIALSKKGLGPEELTLHNEQGRLTAKSVPLQEQVVQLLVDEEAERATRLLFDHAIPAQDRVLVQLGQMLEYQQVAARRAMDESREAYRETVVFIGILLAIAIAVGIVVAFFVMRRTSQTEDVLFKQIIQERKLQKQLSYQASHDALTGLINRFEFENHLERALESVVTEQATHAMLYIDLDQFKIVNDTCGHVAGDELLRQLSTVLQQKIRNSDILVRLGGDEFGVLLEHCTPEHTISVANSLLSTVQEFRFVWEDKSFVIGASIGVVLVDKDSGGIANIMSAADAACYSAKDAGRNRIHVFGKNDAMIVDRYGEMQWVARINEALENNRFQLFCQQIISVGSTGACPLGLIEILVRMKDEKGKLIPPGAFIPAAERYNLMTSLDRWVVKTTFEWLDRNSHITDQLGKCSINLSGQSISDARFLDYLLDLLTESAVPAGKICFEITETAAITNLSEATEFISRLKEIGCSFALDDFGSGLSSFAYLKNLPVDYLKIDGSFVKDIVDDPIDEAMVRSINEIGHVMGKETIAEFVENDQILEKLHDIGVDYAQGFGIDTPKPLDQFVPLSGVQQRATANK